MPGNPSAITTTRTVDPPLAQSAGFRVDANDRQYIDNQIRGCEQQLVSCVISGVNATYVLVDAGSASLSAGDCVALAGSTIGIATVTKATPAALTAAGSAYGVMLVAASAGSVALVAIDGVVPPSITGLGAATGAVRVSSSTSRCETVSTSFTAGDYVIGTCDAQGYLNLDPGYAYPAAGGGGTPWHNVPRTTKTANYTVVSTDFHITCATNTAFTITLPAAPSNGDTYEVANIAAGNNTVSGNGHNINGAATFTLPQYATLTVTYDSTDAVWIAK